MVSMTSVRGTMSYIAPEMLYNFFWNVSYTTKKPSFRDGQFGL